MDRSRLWVAGSGLIAALALAWPVSAGAQVRSTDLALAASQNPSDAEAPPVIELDRSRFEFSLGAYVGRPGGYIRVGENGNRGTKMRLNDDLGVRFSESGDAAVAFHLTPRDAIRATFLYYFLRGQGLLDSPLDYNGEEFKNPGHATIDADFYRVGLAYERTAIVPGGLLTGSLGLTYVHFEPKLSSHGRSNTEDFARAELPVPVVGLRFDIPMGNGFAARGSIGGGGLPRVDSGRKEKGSTVSYIGTEDVDGTPAFKLKIVRKNGDVNFVYLDPDQYLEIRILSQRVEQGAHQWASVVRVGRAVRLHHPQRIAGE